mmetsp:Transcript_19279/g.18978  ORF Transcript_19279/g.18978 Transcript_19279/m.18978 type:complete len:151 (+) Transcript_19279:14-466(+)
MEKEFIGADQQDQLGNGFSNSNESSSSVSSKGNGLQEGMCFKKLKDMSYAEISKLKIFQDNKEEILNKAIEEAKRISKRNAYFKIDEVMFKVHYETQMGQEVKILGYGGLFGNWKPEKAIKLTWSDGHHWTVKVSTEELPKEGEYKYMIS